jgi:hypothetical protein
LLRRKLVVNGCGGRVDVAGWRCGDAFGVELRAWEAAMTPILSGRVPR